MRRQCLLPPQGAAAKHRPQLHLAAGHAARPSCCSGKQSKLHCTGEREGRGCSRHCRAPEGALAEITPLHCAGCCTTEETFACLAQTVLQQSHLAPLPLELQPVYWQVRPLSSRRRWRSIPRVAAGCPFGRRVQSYECMTTSWTCSEPGRWFGLCLAGTSTFLTQLLLFGPASVSERATCGARNRMTCVFDLHSGVSDFCHLNSRSAVNLKRMKRSAVARDPAARSRPGSLPRAARAGAGGLSGGRLDALRGLRCVQPGAPSVMLAPAQMPMRMHGNAFQVVRAAYHRGSPFPKVPITDYS